MAKRPSKKAVRRWEPAGIEVLCVDELFPADTVNILADYLPRVRSYDELRNGILNAAGWYQAFLHDRARPKGTEVRNELESLHEAIETLDRVFDALGHDAKTALEKAGASNSSVGEGIPWQRIFSPIFARSGAARIQHVRAALTEFRNWTSKAQAKTESSRRGRPPHDAEEEVIAQLAEVWRAQSGEDAKLAYSKTRGRYGAFLSFCRGVLMPVWRHRYPHLPSDKEPNLAKIAGKVLYGER